MKLQDFNAMDEPSALQALMTCCGSARWAMAVVRRRPYSDLRALETTAAEAWARCGRDDFLEAFSHHPRIGDKAALRLKFAGGEQGSIAEASEETLDALARGNAEYEKRFGHIFIICATGKSADEMLTLLRARLPNVPETELKIAAGEQAKITKLRLAKLLS